MPAIDINGLLGGFDESRRGHRDAELKRAQANQDREYSILSALAQHIDPEIASIGATGLLHMAGAGGPKAGKGLSGFLGEVDSSTYMPMLQQAFAAHATGAGPTNAEPTPGSAAQPDAAMVEPQQIAAAGHTPLFTGSGAPPPGIGNGVTAPQFGAQTPSSDLGGPPGMQMGPANLGIPGPPPQQAPETPQAKMKRLYPSAGDIAADTRYKELQGRLKAVLEGIRGAKTPQEADIVRGLAGAPRRATKHEVWNAEYQGADGQTMSGSVVFDPETGETTVGGEPVQVTKRMPNTTPRPIRTNMKASDGTINAVYSEPGSGEVQWSVNTGMPVSEPPPYSGTATVDGHVVRLPRGGGEPEVLGDAPLPAGALTIDQQEATTWLTDVNTAVKAQLSTFNQNRPGGMKATSLPAAQQDALVQKITRGRFKTVGELTAATKRQAPAPTNAPGAGNPMDRERANRVRRRLEGGQGSRIQGPGLQQ